MRVIRKILKRKVSIVMAVLVILGIAVYGVSAFAQQAYCTTVTLDNNYVYLNPAGMIQNSIDWGSPANNGKIYLGYIPSGESSTTWVAAEEKDGTGCWKWKIDSLTNVSKGTELFFTYATDWNTINKNAYYRTEGYVVAESKDELKGLVFEQNGTSTKIKDATAYALKLLTSNAGSTLTFVDMTGEKKGIKAQFSYNDDYTTKGDYTTVDLSDNKATVPNNNGIKIYQYMRFVDADGITPLSDSVNIEEALKAGGTLYYGMKQDTNATTATSEWSNSKISSTAPNITKLYFDATSFPVNDANSIMIKVGDGKETPLQKDSPDESILSYDLSGKSVAANTIITVSYNGIIYRFYPNGIRNVVKIDGDKAEINDIYRESTGKYTVYFDATLSKLQYDNRDAANNSLPRDNENIYYYAWGENLTPVGGLLQKVESVGTNTLKGDVYSADLTNKYEHILFYSANNQIIPNNNNTGVDDNSSKTCDLTIPWSSVTAPCFYADTSDDSIYTAASSSIATSLRSGYWDEVGRVRDADGKKKDGTYNIYNNGIIIDTGNARQDQQVVDIPEGTLTRDSDMLYVNTTLYDYYSDYELNGYNRDKYSRTDLSDNKTNLHFIYQPFRQFDQALSSYYSQYLASSPIYWGNFQNYNGSPYSDISSTLKLYGSDKWSKFIFNNNSMWGSDATNDCPGTVGNLSNGNNATQGLVSDTLSDNNLMIKTSSGTVKAPYFDESFLTGNNSKNTVLGKVYKGVTFPFVKEKMNSKSDSSARGTVEYWTFDSAKDAKNGNLELQHSEADGYFLNPTKNVVYGQTADKEFPDTSAPGKSGKNYFPFNNNNQSGTAAKLNYGFGQKFDLKFRLSSDGTVTTSENVKVPIEFNFSGDDDVWVFIDGKLVLDVGGGHGKVSGTINFRDKTVTVSGIKNTTTAGASENVTKSFDAIKAEDNTKEHTLTMFYMERGLWESNLSLSFNFPDENEFQVEKNVDTTDVAEDFKSCFDDVSAFPFTILNQATHYAAKVATGGQEIKNRTFNETFKGNTIANVGDNTFAYLETCKDDSDRGTAKSDVVHWKAELSDESGQYKEKRWGIIYPSSPGKENEFNATYKIGEGATNHYKYLQFSLYDGVVTETPSLNNMYVELEDSSKNTIGGFLSAGNTYNSLNLKKGKWNTITIDLDKLSKNTTTFDYSKIVNIKFDYNLSRDMYLDDFTFIPSTEVTQPTGFVTKQYEIPDYGSVASGTLMYPVNAVYTVSSGSSSTTNLLGADGTFTLANGETATFEDQFRRGSYIALSEDVDTEVFEPSWTLYENGEEVKSTVPANSTTVTQAEQVTLPTQNGQYLKDGRQEKYVSGKDSDGQEQSNTGYTITGWAKKNGTTSPDSDRDETNTIVFRSFTDPDSSTTATKLKVKYTNKVKTGAIRIEKAGAYLSDTATTLDQEYQIKVTFTNIAGMALENGDDKDKYTYTYKLKLGDSKEITGIPAGTEYTISEILPNDGSSLNDIAIVQPTYDGEESKYTATKVKDSSGNWVIHGKIKADSTAENTVFTFKNTKKPVINLTVVKNWTGTKNNTTLPDSVTVKLQRRVIATPQNEWKDVPVTDSEGKETPVITLRPDNQNADNSWKYVFRNLDRYPDYTTSQENPYEYRVVEVVKDGKTYKELSTGDYFNDCFKVQSYNGGNNVSADNSETSTVDKTYTITNVYSPKTNIKITKVDASNSDVKLNDVQFTLEKLIPVSGGSESYEADTSFGTNGKMIAETSGNSTDNLNTPLGIAEFKDLPDGRYRLTETKAKAGYSLLKDPIIIVIDRTGTTIVRSEGERYDASKHNYTFGENDDTKNTISLQISNRMKFLLPKTGGYGAMLFILCGMALATLGCLIFFLITLRKEVQYSRLKRQRRNAIGK